MGLEQHLAGDAAAELEAGQGADAVEVEAQLDGRHADEAAVGVHDAVVVAEGEGAGAAEGVAGQEGDGRVGEVEDCLKHLSGFAWG